MSQPWLPRGLSLSTQQPQCTLQPLFTLQPLHNPPCSKWPTTLTLCTPSTLRPLHFSLSFFPTIMCSQLSLNLLQHTLGILHNIPSNISSSYLRGLLTLLLSLKLFPLSLGSSLLLMLPSLPTCSHRPCISTCLGSTRPSLSTLEVVTSSFSLFLGHTSYKLFTAWIKESVKL